MEERDVHGQIGGVAAPAEPGLIEPGELFAGHRVVRPLSSREIRCGEINLAADRWLVLEPRTLADRTLTVIRPAPVGGRSVTAAERMDTHLRHLSEIEEPHTLVCEAWGGRRDADGSPVAWAISPYTGSHDGLLTLADLVALKGGRMAPYEAERVLEQLLSASASCHDRGLTHGPIAMDDLLVDRRGSLRVELYGLRTALVLGGLDVGELRRDEVRSIAKLGYQLLTGIEAEEPMVPAARLVKRLPAAWTSWLDRGLDAAAGYDSAKDAAAVLPSLMRADQAAVPVVPARVLSGFRRVVPAGSGWRLLNRSR